MKNKSILFLVFYFWFFQTSMQFIPPLLNQDLGSPIVIILNSGNLAILFLCLLYVWNKKRLKFNFFTKIPKVKTILFLILFFFWSGISLFWTEMADPIKAFCFWFFDLFSVYTLFLLCKMEKMDYIIKASIMGYLVPVCLFSIFLLITNPAGIGLRMSKDALIHPNGIGSDTAIAGLFVLFLVEKAFNLKRRHKLFLILPFIIFMLTLLLSISKTAIVGFIISYLVFIGVKKTSFQKKCLLFSSLALVFIGTLPFLMNKLESYSENDLSNLSGRTKIWNFAFKFIEGQPWIGYGIGSFPSLTQIYIGTAFYSAHNEWINVWFQYGLIGLGIVILLYFYFFQQIIKQFKYSIGNYRADVALALFVYIFIHSMAEASTYSISFSPYLILIFSLWLHEGAHTQKQSLA